MDATTISALVVAVLGAGGVSALGTNIARTWLDKRKMDADTDGIRIEKMQQRIDHLESENRECMARSVEMGKRIGYLEAKVESLELYCETLRQKITSTDDLTE